MTQTRKHLVICDFCGKHRPKFRVNDALKLGVIAFNIGVGPTAASTLSLSKKLECHWLRQCFSRVE